MDKDAVKKLNMDELAAASGGSSLRSHPMYDDIKEFYKEKGSLEALLLCTFYHLSKEDSEEMIQIIAEEVESGV